MADAVTYADLKFNEIPMKEIKTADDFQENVVDDGDVTYENFTGTKPSRVRTELPTFRTGPERPLRTDIDLSHQFHHLSVSHMEVISNGTQSLKRWQMEKERLGWNMKDLNTSLLERKEAAEESLKKAMSLIENLNTSLLESLQKVKKSTDEKETVEEHLKKAKFQIEELNKGFCPKNWILFGKTCLLFSEKAETWWKSKTFCENKESHMIVVQKEDDAAALKDFFAEKQEDFWVGKELKGNYWNQEWKWPEYYDYKSYNCWKLSNRKLTTESCQSKNKCICQKNLLLTSMKTHEKYNDKYFSFSLWDLEYECRHP
ncbi:oxidized low-density lipoprotein receptor 1-like isoform X2 [Bufo bufo]|uniref:oxidized low-density lipoprotein receptor 1-like isoform X2 n=1 Tax=Bufo bufo TaxID=8384 RepID=UPI001ABE36BC|nr:oxidized low-density lipoprotein receptor 1-like isoform X2 [Bufo bufo]